MKEQIVRTNTNRLNPRSYWYCLDQGGPQEKVDAYKELVGSGGFIDSFQAIDRALGAGGRRRTGRPANKNLLTLVTLGSEPLTVESFIGSNDLVPSEKNLGAHLGAWLFREAWASGLGDDSDASYARKAGLVESEFALRWVTLDPRATWCLCNAALSPALEEFISLAPKIGDREPAKAAAAANLEKLERDLATMSNVAEVEAFHRDFKATGQGRSLSYETAIARRFAATPFGRGLPGFGTLKPDITLGEYEPCAVTSSKSDDAKSIEEAIRRTCQVIEFTAHLQPDMRGLREYVREKVEAYAALLEGV